MSYLTIKQAIEVIYVGKKLELDPEDLKRVEECYHFLEKFSADKVIYGINTGFGPMAQWRVEDAYLNDLQYNIIRSHSTGAGEPLGNVGVVTRLKKFIIC